MAMTLKQARFVEAYFGEANGNGREAAATAGYKGDAATLSQTAYVTLRSAEVKEAIAEILTPEGVQKELSKVATLPAELLGALPSKVRSLELLGKMHGLWSDKLQISLDRDEVERAIRERIAAMQGSQPEAERLQVTEPIEIEVTRSTD